MAAGALLAIGMGGLQGCESILPHTAHTLPWPAAAAAAPYAVAAG